MYAVDTRETIHIYYEREEQPKPVVVLPIVCAVLCLLGIVAVTLYSAEYPSYEHARLRVPAIALPPQTFTARVAVIPTGVKTYPATTAHGSLTFSNGSVIGLSIPQGFSVDGAAIDSAVYVPPATANGFGTSTVPAHLLTSGINKPTLAINEVIGSSLFVRNLSPFTGGRPAYSVKFATPADKQAALLQARSILLSKSSGLHYPCAEQVSGAITVTWRCQFVKYTLPSYMHVTAVRLSGKNLIIDVFFMPRPTQRWVK